MLRTTSFGWTEDSVLIELLTEIAYSGEKVDLLSDRKQGGVHKVLRWPTGHSETHCDMHYELGAKYGEPCFSRADIAWGRYMSDGCTFLVWEYFEDDGIRPRPGTLQDALAIWRYQQGEARVAQLEVENRRRMEERCRAPSIPAHRLSEAELAQGPTGLSGGCDVSNFTTD